MLTYRNAEPVWLLWIALIIAAPLFAEVFFIGFLLSGFSSSFMGSTAALNITSALWAVIRVQHKIYAIIIIF
ncbi:MAG: membrane protease YdiL (CAAX protease family) [Cellvibrionaceae bacterium]|jgi:membrane protease YdiL (CAAX protease family)